MLAPDGCRLLAREVGGTDPRGWSLADCLRWTPPGWAVVLRDAWAVVAEHGGRVRIIQAREKWGDLEVYVHERGWWPGRLADAPPLSPERAEVMRRLRPLCDRAAARCQVCGAPAQLRRDLPPDGSWWATLCSAHATAVLAGTTLEALYRAAGGGA